MHEKRTVPLSLWKILDISTFAKQFSFEASLVVTCQSLPLQELVMFNIRMAAFLPHL